jgi:phosphinothricin acetyltransferase
MSEALTVRVAAPGDLARITEIYNHYVVTTPITFDVAPFRPEERAGWFAQFGARGRHRLLVAERGGRVIGYAGTMQYKPKPAYETSVEVTIYVEEGATGGGVGPKLYEALFASIAGEDVHRALAGITLPNPRSIALHERFGFEPVGTYHEVGRKLGRYWDVVWMQKRL